MSYHTAGPLEHLRAVRRSVFGHGKGRAAANSVEYRRGDESLRIIAVPVAMTYTQIEGIGARLQGWLVAAAEFEKTGLAKPRENDVLSFGGEEWTVMPASGSCFERRSYGKDFLIYTKLTGAGHDSNP